MASAEKLNEIKDDYISSLSDLTINSKPLINMLTMLAEENIENAAVIVQAVEEHLEKVRSEYKLPVLYLIDSIVKNVGNAYAALFTQNIVANFCSVFEKVDERTRSSMFKLRQTWSEVFPPKKMYALDVRVNAIDPAWPIIAPPPTPSIHVNPKFFNKSAGKSSPVTTAPTPVVTTGTSSTTADSTLDMRAQLINKQKELLELQQRKIELELLQAKVKLEEQQKQFALSQSKSQQKKAAVSTPIPTTTSASATTSSLPSMKTVLTKPNALPTVTKSSEITKSSSSRQSLKNSSQSVSKSSTTSSSSASNGPRIAPVNSALLASARNVSRDPRLAAKQHSSSVSNQLSSKSESIVDLKSSSKSEPVVNFEKTDKSKIDNKILNKQTSSLQTSIKDPRLLSSKVHGQVQTPLIPSTNPQPSPATTGVSGGAPTASSQQQQNKGKSSSRESQISPTGSSRSTKESSGRSKLSKKQKKSDRFPSDDKSDKSPLKSEKSKTSSSSRSPTKSKHRKEHSGISSGSSSNSITSSPSNKKSSSTSSSSLDSVPKRSPDKYSASKHKNRPSSATTVNKYDEMDIANSPSPPPPAFHVESTTAPAKAEEKGGGFKELKSSTKSRNYIRRNRTSSPLVSQSPQSPSSGSNQQQQDGVAAPTSKDVDLRVGGPPPEKQPRLQLSPSSGGRNEEVASIDAEDGPKKISEQKSTLVIDVNAAASKDVDLRQLPTIVPAVIGGKKRSSTDKVETTSAKKSKAEMFDVLFGNEDVDLRTLPTATPPLQPPTPPPPMISSPSRIGSNTIPTATSTGGSNSAAIIEDNSGWQKVKETKGGSTVQQQQQSPISHLATVRAKLASATNRDRLGRPLLYNKLPDDPTERKRTITSSKGDIDLRRLQKPPVIKTNAASIKLFLQEAEEKRKNGKMSADQYQNAMEQVIAIVERQQLRKAKRMESIKDTSSSSVSGNDGHNVSLQPISDDELSADFSEDDDDLEIVATKDVDERAQQQPPSVHAPTELIELDDQNASQNIDPNPMPKGPENVADVGGGGTGIVGKRQMGKSERGEREGLRNRRWNDQPKWERPHHPVQRSNPWIHPPLGLMEKQNPFNNPGPWKPINFMPPVGPMGMMQPGGAGFQAPEFLENRPNVAVGGFVQRPPICRYGPRSDSPPAIGSQTTRELPLADPLVLEFINNDSMRTINIDGNPTEIRYYGDTAVTIKGDDAIEIAFQDGTRRITFGEKESYILSFNDVAREVMISGVPHRVRLGAPTRELYIDDKWYECFFGGPGIVIEIDREYKVVKLEGPPPQVKIGKKRSDLCVGRINLIINAKNIVPIYLDAKPQKFDIEGKLHTLRFVDALRTVLINEEPFKVDFGGLPKPIIVHSKKHFIRFTRLPPGIRPGYVDIKDMEGERFIGSPPRPDNENSMDKSIAQAAPLIDNLTSSNEPVFYVGKRRPAVASNVEPTENVADANVAPSQNSGSNNNPPPLSNILSNFNLDLLSSIIKPAMAPSSNINTSGYNTNLPISASDASTEIPGLGGLQPPAVSLPPQPQTPAIGLTAPPRSFEELKELVQKLEATGILSNVSENLQQPKESRPVPDISEQHVIKPVDFGQPETLKAKQPAIVGALYSGMQCSSCGVRFPPEHTIKYSRQHLDWHYRQNKKKKHSVRKANSRKWFYDVSDWIQYEEIEDLEEREKSWFENQQLAASGSAESGAANADEPVEEEEIPSVDARSAGDNPRCDVCYDTFDQFYNEEKEEWHLRMAVRVDDKLYHPLCYEDYKTSLAENSVTDTTAEISTIEIKDEGDEIKDNDVEEIVAVDDDDTKSSDKKEIIIEDDSNPSNADESNTTDKLTGEVEDEKLLDTSEPDVCIILPEEEIPIVRIDDKDDDDDETYESTRETPVVQETEQKPQTKHKMVDFVLADGSVVKIKSEPLDPDLEDPEEITTSSADNTNAGISSSIDGNVQLEPAVDITNAVPSGRIKINISKPFASKESSNLADKQSIHHHPSSIYHDESSLSHSPLLTITTDSSEPPPPGEEPPLQIKLKPALQGVNLKVMPPVNKGCELSGLCSIM